jgi:chromosome segregation ATPase
MSTYHDPSIAELEDQMKKLHAASDAGIARWGRLVSKTNAREAEIKERILNVDKHVVELKVAAIAPHILTDAKKLPHTQLQLKVAHDNADIKAAEYKRLSELNQSLTATLKDKAASEDYTKLQLKIAHYNADIKAAEYKRLETRRFESFESESRLKKDNKRLSELNQSLTATLEDKAASENKVLESENDRIKEELARLKAQLEKKTKECEQKDAIIAGKEQDIAGLKEDIAANETDTDHNSSHNHEGCDELEAAIQEQSDFFSSRCTDLEVKVRTLTAERDDFQSKLKVSEVTLRRFDHCLTQAVYRRSRGQGRHTHS